MYSKLVARQWEEATEVASSVLKNSDQVAAALAERFAADPVGPPVDWKAVLGGLARQLVGASRNLTEQDSDYQVQLLLEKQGRERRNQAAARLRKELRGARFLLDEAFGRTKASGYFPDRGDLTRIRPRDLVPAARAIAVVLRGAEVEWPDLGDETHVPERERLAAGLEAGAAELERRLQALAPERSGSIFARGSKKSEYEATRKTLTTFATTLAGLYRIAGFDYAAQRLRRSRKRKKAEESEAPPAGFPPPPTS